ncbi:MAG: ABC transporter substrate-binding protein [Candidatus Kapaibacterium sp.]
MARYRNACLLAIIMLASVAGCGGGDNAREKGNAPSGTSWGETERKARGQTVNLSMWQGDPYINAYMKSYVIPALKERYGVTLNILGGQGNTLVSTLMTEMEAGSGASAYDMMWINGETFYQLRQIKALYGPFVDRLPNARYVDFGNRFINTDFQQPVDGYESPWGNVQLAIIYDTLHVPDPPRTMAALESYVRAHPGKFTFDNSFTGMTFLKCLLIDLAGGEKTLAGKFNEDNYRRYSSMLWEYLNRIKPYFWKGGRSFPAEVAQLHQMFANGEVDFSMSNNDGEVDKYLRESNLTFRSAKPSKYGFLRRNPYQGTYS